MSNSTKIRTSRRLRVRLLLRWLVALFAIGCGSDTALAPPEAPAPEPPAIDLDGSWRALYWIAETASGTVFDVITEGGSLVLQVAGTLVTGSMHVPENVTNGAPLTVSMEGTVRLHGDSVRFEQSNDTFVQRAAWTHHPGEVFNALVLHQYPVEGTHFTVVLVRNW